jgi:hypothetical protein
MDVKELGYEGVDWTYVAQDRVQWQVILNTAMNLRVPLREGNSLTS